MASHVLRPFRYAYRVWLRNTGQPVDLWRFAARLGRINLDASGDANFLRISKLGWIVLELRGGYERLLPNGERKGLKESFERRIGKNIGIRRVCRFWLLYIVIRIMHDLLSLLKDIISESRWKGTGNFFDFPNYNFDSLILISNFSCCRGNETWWKV